MKIKITYDPKWSKGPHSTASTTDGFYLLDKNEVEIAYFDHDFYGEDEDPSIVEANVALCAVSSDAVDIVWASFWEKCLNLGAEVIVAPDRQLVEIPDYIFEKSINSWKVYQVLCRANAVREEQVS